MENKFLVLHKRHDGDEIIVRASSVTSLSHNELGTIVDMGGSENNYYAVRESYEEVKEMLVNG